MAKIKFVCPFCKEKFASPIERANHITKPEGGCHIAGISLMIIRGIIPAVIAAKQDLGNKPQPIPKQYRKKSESLIYELGQIANQLWPIVSELGDNIKIECDCCKIVISKK